jgi:polyferredoxin
LCIDACDSVMAQVGRPRGLIDYCTLEDSEREAHGEADTPLLKTILRPRTLIYFTVWAAIGAGLLFMLGTRSRLALSVAKDRNPEYVQLSGGAVRDGFTVKVRNMEDRPRPIVLTTSGVPGALLYTDDMDEHAAQGTLAMMVPPDTTLRLRLYMLGPKGARPGQVLFRLKATDRDAGQDHAHSTFSTAEGNGQ